MGLAATDPLQVKRALQETYELVESGHLFRHPGPIVEKLHELLSHQDQRVRGWSYKLAAVMKATALHSIIRNNMMEVEPDGGEQQQWAAAAFFGLAPAEYARRTIAELDERFYRTPMEIASQLFVRGEPLVFRPQFREVDFDDQPLARRWQALLVGHEPTRNRSIDPRYVDVDMVRDRIDDPDELVREYSFFAEQRNPEGSAHFLKRPLATLTDEPNVRRWIIRLAAKDDDSAAAHAELIERTMDPVQEMEIKVREGLAIALGDLDLTKMTKEVADWFANEADPDVRRALVPHLVRRAGFEPTYKTALRSEVAGRPEDDPIVSTIRAHSPREFFEDIDRKANIGQMGLQLDPGGSRMAVTVNNYGPIGNQTVGDVTASTIETVQNNDRFAQQGLSAPLQDLLQAMPASNLPDGQQDVIREAIEDAARPDTQKDKAAWKSLATAIQMALKLPNLTAEFLTKCQTVYDQLKKMGLLD